MFLKAEQGTHLVFLGTSQFMKAGATEPLNFVNFGDPVAYQNYTFLMPKDKLQILNGITQNTPVDVTFEMGLYQNRPTITPVSVTPAKTLQKA